MVIRSKDNARVKEWARLVADPRERRRRGRVLIEGVHLVEEFLRLGRKPIQLIVSEAALESADICRVLEGSEMAPTLLTVAVFSRIADVEAPSGIAAEIVVEAMKFDPALSDGCIFLDGIQDAGNVGAILRSAAAFGGTDAILGPGCADPWSPKALRAGMGGQFYLRLMTSSDLIEDVRRFSGQIVCTVARGGAPLESIELVGRTGWIFGSEGAGVSDALAARADRKATISMSGRTESLNVAASAAICLYERSRQISKRAALS